MSPVLRMWIEVVFDLTYLAVIWALVAAMMLRLKRLPGEDLTARRFAAAFGLLALGDTGHVGFRVVAYAVGDANLGVPVAGGQVTLIGLGALATAITVTLTYLLLLFVWQARFQKPFGWFGGVLIAAAVARLLLFFDPANRWSDAVPPQPWSLYRNLPLMLQGLGVAALFLRDARAARDRPFVQLGVAILVSYAFYIPVVLFVQQVPLLGMLMIPKTLAYLAMAWIGFRALFAKPSKREERAAPLHAQPSH